MTVNNWITSHYDKFKHDCLGITRGDALGEELCHFILLEFMNKKEAQTIVESGGAFYYIIRMALTNWNSVTSPFYRIYRQPYTDIETITERAEEIPDAEDEWDIDALAAQAQKSLQELGWYERELFNVYLEHNTNASLVSRQTGIPRTSISLTLKHVKQHLRSNIK